MESKDVYNYRRQYCYCQRYVAVGQQTAAASSVGKFVLQLAQQYRFKTINVIRRREQASIIRNLRGDEVICTADEDLSARFQQLTAGKGVERAIDCVAGELGAELARNLAPGGTMLVMEPFPVIGRRIPRNSSCRSLLRA